MLILAEHSRPLAVVLLWPTHGIVCAVLSDIRFGCSLQGLHSSHNRCGVCVQVHYKQYNLHDVVSPNAMDSRDHYSSLYPG